MIRGFEDEAFISALDLRKDAGGISDMTLWRWERRYADFPKIHYIMGRKYYRLGEWRKFKSARLSDVPPAAPGRSSGTRGAA